MEIRDEIAAAAALEKSGLTVEQARAKLTEQLERRAFKRESLALGLKRANDELCQRLAAGEHLNPFGEY